MSTKLLMVGALNHVATTLRNELAARPGVAFVRWNLGAMLTRMREATENRAMVWQGVRATKPAWAASAVERFGPELLARLEERAGRAERIFGVLHFENSLRIEALAAAFTDAKFLHVVRDGTVPVCAGDDAAAPTWAMYVEPIVRMEVQLGTRLLTVREEDLRVDPTRELARVLDWLELDGPREWTTAFARAVDPRRVSQLLPPPQARLSGASLQVFLAHGPARRLLEHFDYAAPEPDASIEKSSHGAQWWAQHLVEAGRFDEADALLVRCLQRAPSAGLHEALGDLRARQHRDADAVLAYLRAIQLDAGHVSAWTKIFAFTQRPEPMKLVEYARSAPQVEVRRAFSRWLIARGLDPEAAQIIATVEHR